MHLTDSLGDMVEQLEILIFTKFLEQVSLQQECWPLRVQFSF